eukprot:CAMPEP_0201889244 /NCGR_PEP_ID=MMETSP0902-20130614/29520_1 /ASSEMBLY_ACC=CAM_ASM_000551 /TAXON_ID=420261 /ORGANISM="Thalassiosira antarctica, Strain CCMP982" /LENGTH=187 /DNA_ID=CAMNT_0048419757 /DNA_START=19 /DNA_END=582 /DNA_ORIENTATION=+
MKFAILTLLLAPSTVISFVPAAVPTAARSNIDTFPKMHSSVDDNDNPNVIINGAPSPSGVQHRRAVLKTSAMIAAFLLGTEPQPSQAMEEQKIYSNNARNFARLNNGDSSGGSVYDNNPTSPKARARRAMVGCKDTSARSLAGESIGKKQLSEKDCNILVMGGEADVMLGALTKLDCPTCPYGIGSP